MAAATDAKNHSKKRKQSTDDVTSTEPFHQVVGLQMLSDEEGQEDVDAVSDDGEVDDFPEIDVRSDSRSGSDAAEDTDGDDDDDDDDDEESEEGDSDDSDDSSLHIFPQAKTIVSDITGQQKRVYPEIEPDYDSDSSTEDVRPV